MLFRYLWIVSAALAIGLPAIAQETTADSSQEAEEAESQTATDTSDIDLSDEIEKARRELLRRQRQSRPIDPSRSIETERRPAPVAPMQRPVQTGHAIGTSPTAIAGVGRPRSEGDLIIYRRGRLLRASDGPTPWLFAFDSDGSGLDEAPLFLMPCKELEVMEQWAGEHGADAPFVVSGEVFEYRGQRYFLPRVVRVWQDRGNLK